MNTLVFLTVALLIALPFDLDAKRADKYWRIKRQDDQWSWGYTDTDQAQNATVLRNSKPEDKNSTTTTEQPEPANPCSPEEPVYPDFNLPGRRISEVSPGSNWIQIPSNRSIWIFYGNLLFTSGCPAAECYEYIYAIKVRDDKARNHQACLEARRKKRPHGGGGHAVGGRDALPGEFPHMVAIGWKAAINGWIFKCGGSLISDRYVLTAAHCSKASERDTSISEVDPKIVRLGDKNIDDGIIKVRKHGTGINVTKTIKRVIDHPDYKAPKKYFDIALIELEESVEFNKYIQPACLGFGQSRVLVGQKATLTGWGVIETVTKKTSSELQAAVVEIFDSSLCDELLTPSCNRHWCKMENHQLCAGKLEGGVDACQGDSGGPLQIKIPLPATTSGRMYHVVGVTSFGIGCALPNLPGIYTRVASFVDWIEGIVWQ